MTEKTRSEYTFLNMISGFGGYFVNVFLSLISRIIFTRVFTADYLGLSGLYTNVIGVLSLAELGISSAITFALYDPLAKNDTTKISALMKFYSKCYRIIGVVVFVIGLALLPFLDLIITEKPDINENFTLIYLIFLFNTASTYFFSYRGSLLVAAQKNYLITLANNIIVILQILLQIVVMLVFKSYIGYLLVMLVSVFATNVYSYFLTQKHYPYLKDKNVQPLEKEEKRSLIRNVRALTITRIGGMLVNSTDNIIITYFSNLAAVGLKANYTYFTSNLVALINMVFTSLTASVGNHNVLESKEKKLSLFYSINLANFWLYGWAAIGACVVTTDLVKLMFGEHYVLPWNIPLILAVNFYMLGMQNAVSTYFSTHGLFRHCRYLVLLTAAINLVASFVLGKYMGLFGILLATAISRLFTNTWYNPYAVFKYVFDLPFRLYVKRYVYYLIVLVITGAICWFICSFIDISLLANAIIKFLICSIIPNAVFFALFRKTEDFKLLLGFVQGILNKFNRFRKKQ